LNGSTAKGHDLVFSRVAILRDVTGPLRDESKRQQVVFQGYSVALSADGNTAMPQHRPSRTRCTACRKGASPQPVLTKKRLR
jgi:hypothetical protein